MLPSGLQRLLGQHLLRWQERAHQIAEQLRAMRLEGRAGGGQVRAVVSGLGELLEVHIDPQLLTPDAREVVEDLIVVAVREAMRQAEEAQRRQVQEALGELPLGGLLNFGR